MKKLKTVVFGTGFVGRVHIEGIRRLGNVELYAIGVGPQDDGNKLAAELTVDRVSADYATLVSDPNVDAVHVCTPNALHFPIAKAALAAGKHVLCEKPLAMSVEEARALVDLAAKTGLRNCTFHNLRFYPMIQQARRIVASGELGDVLIVQGTYSQDWLLYDTDWNWRLISAEGGRSRTLADIGSHWCDGMEHVTGQKITSLCADIQTFHKTRKRPKKAVDTFSGKALRPEDYEDVAIDTEDYAAVMFRMGERTRGSFTVSQVSSGRKNSYRFEIFGTKAGLAWDGEKQDELWIGHRGSPNQLLLKDPSLLSPEARSYADLPGGHSEGYDDTFKQVFRRFYRSIEDPKTPADYPQFADGLRQLTILDAEFTSHERQGWVNVSDQVSR
ncbi:MAG: Gfo/Idh/MocA family oxidoreductase [Bryobacteraceae bacterium]